MQFRAPQTEQRGIPKPLQSEDEAVYNLEIEGNHNYFANGILVKNCDEGAFFERDEYMFNNVLMPMLATTEGKLIVSSTPWSSKSMFYEYCKRKFHERLSQHYASWRDAVEAGLISKKFIEDMQATLLPQQFTMEFEAEFVEDVDAWLPQDLIARCIDSEAELMNEDEVFINS